MLYRLDLKQGNLAIIQLLSLLVSDLTDNMYNVSSLFGCLGLTSNKKSLDEQMNKHFNKESTL